MVIEEIINQIKAYNPQKIILFGSQASGNPTKDSDIDIVVIKDTPEPYHERLIKLRRLVRTTTPIDFFVFTNEEIEVHKDNSFVLEIIKKGKVVYEQ